MSVFLTLADEESSGKVNIDELYEKKKARDLKQLTIFNKLLNRVHTRIRVTGRNTKNDQHIWFAVPEYIFGEAVYNKAECIAYLVNKLQDNGFLVKYIHPNTMFISWSNYIPQYIRAEFKKKTGKIMNEKGDITDPKKDPDQPGETDLNQGLFNTQGGPVTPKKDQKQFTPIDKYKPSGKFVYDDGILEKIDRRFN
jgi:hypothetical protein